MQNPFTSAYSIAETVLLDAPGVPNQRSVDYLGRIANYSRQATRPRHPKRLDFQLSMEFVPASFVTFDVTVGQKRHLMFATERQLGLLCSAKRWYVDATLCGASTFRATLEHTCLREVRHQSQAGPAGVRADVEQTLCRLPSDIASHPGPAASAWIKTGRAASDQFVTVLNATYWGF